MKRLSDKEIEYYWRLIRKAVRMIDWLKKQGFHDDACDWGDVRYTKDGITVEFEIDYQHDMRTIYVLKDTYCDSLVLTLSNAKLNTLKQMIMKVQMEV